MALGTMAAIGLGAAGIGSALSASSQKKAAKKAANASQYAADQSAAVQREQLQAAQNALNPYQQAGVPATGMINALLGIPAAQPVTPQPAPTTSPAFDAPVAQSGGAQIGPWQLPGMISGFGGGTFNMDGTQATPVQQSFAPITQPTAEQAFNTYRNNTGYQFRVGEGMKALDARFSGMGSLKSGAALKSALDYGQGIASQEFGNYLSSLDNQQRVGLSAGSALAGVGQNFANSMGTIYQNNGANQANAALVRGQNNPFANALGVLGGGLFGLGK